MAKRDPNKFEVKGNPSIWVTIARHSRDGDHEKDALWHYVFWYQGKRHRGSTGKLEHADAVEVARKAAETVMNAVISPAGGLKLDAAITQYLDLRWPKDKTPDVRKGNRSYQDAKSRLDAFKAFAGEDVQLSALDMDAAKGLFRNFLKQRKRDGMSARTVINDKLILSRFCSELLDTSPAPVRWPGNPLRNIKTEKPDSADPVPLTEDEIQAVLAKGKASTCWPLIVLCLGMGLRPREATRVQWKHVSFKDNTVTVFGKKRGRTPKMSPWTAAQLQAIKTASPDASQKDFLFPHNSFTAFDWFAEVRKAAFEDGGEHITLQALRRTAARKAAPKMTTQQYAAYFGHGLAVAQKHYLGYGLDGIGGTVDTSALDYTASPSSPPHKAPHEAVAKSA